MNKPLSSDVYYYEYLNLAFDKGRDLADFDLEDTRDLVLEETI